MGPFEGQEAAGGQAAGVWVCVGACVGVGGEGLLVCVLMQRCVGGCVWI